MPDPHLRAADTDREAVATALGEHMAAGRLTLAEYDERVAKAWAARTYGDLAQLTADLPALAPAVPGPRAQDVATPHPGTFVCGPMRMQPAWPTVAPWTWHGDSPERSWRAWLATSITVLVVYLAIALVSWELHYFWPMWVIGPWGAALLVQRVSGGHGHGRGAPGT